MHIFGDLWGILTVNRNIRFKSCLRQFTWNQYNPVVVLALLRSNSNNAFAKHFRVNRPPGVCHGWNTRGSPTRNTAFFRIAKAANKQTLYAWVLYSHRHHRFYSQKRTGSSATDGHLDEALMTERHRLIKIILNINRDIVRADNRLEHVPALNDFCSWDSWGAKSAPIWTHTLLMVAFNFNVLFFPWRSFHRRLPHAGENLN